MEHFRNQQEGSYVHFTSTSGLIGNIGQANYSAAKLGIVGMSTNIALDSLFQETDNVHAGSFAVRLQLGSGTHKRFTTQPMAVTAGTTYDITFWVRGRGQIRTNIYDGRATGSGYGTYNPYVELTDGITWQEVTQSVSCTNSSAEGEFIFSVLGTSGPEPNCSRRASRRIRRPSPRSRPPPHPTVHRLWTVCWWRPAASSPAWLRIPPER